jgi:hypothetical protein
MGRSNLSPLRITRATRNRASDITNRDLERIREVARGLVRTKGDRTQLTDVERASAAAIRKRGGAASSLLNRALDSKNQATRRAVASRAGGELTLRKRDPNYRGQPGGTGQMPRQGQGPLAPRA